MSTATSTKKRSPWAWIPSLYFAEGIPYIIVMFVASDMYKTLGIPNSTLALWTGLLYLPWVIKPLWSPFVDMYSTKRNWIFWMQMALAVMFFGVSLSLHLPWWFPMTIFFLWGMAFSSSTHDIAADGFYILGLNQHDQAFFTGIRSTFYRLAMIAGLGLLGIITGMIIDRTGLETVRININSVPASEIGQATTESDVIIPEESDGIARILVFPSVVNVPLASGRLDSSNVYIVLSAPPEEAMTVTFGQKKGSQDIHLTTSGVMEFDQSNWNIPQKQIITVTSNLRERTSSLFEAKSGDVPFGWSVSIAFLGGLFIIFALYHRYILPRPQRDTIHQAEDEKSSYGEIFASFFRQEGIVASVLFMLLYRFSEAQLTKMASPFLLDGRENGGLALSLTEKSFAYGTVGLLALLIGGVSGGILASRHGLKKWIWWMALAINIPNTVYIFMSYTMPSNLFVINAMIAIEQFGYGFGFTGYMLYMLYVAGQGKHETAHFAITTGFMALGMMIPGMISGYIQEFLGYQHFFIYVILCTIPSFIALYFIKIDSEFGKKTATEA
ncbi:MAG: MFS transporter [Candidatus Marinimicrobia bacterium]|nr:MFS transporter [Candidatus Neomarinimicrobiota bacterium]MCF7922552.1 MFS transporter [Candidatus Neomarinimicrobiota bacterium]